MTLRDAFIPYGAFFSTPFCRWQGQLSGEHSVRLASRVAVEVMKEKGIDPACFDGLVLGMTVPQEDSFYGAPWAAAMIGAPGITGPTVSQACATSARAIAAAALDVKAGQRECVLALTCDRTSNGPHMLFPDPSAPGGRGKATDWVWDAFNRDPFAKDAMIQTAERVAAAEGFTREQQEEVTVLRHGQYQDAMKDDRAFQRRFMAAVTVGRGKRATKVVADEGVHPTTAEGLAKLRPAVDGGTVTFGSQTYPADGAAGLVVCARDRADALSRDPKVVVRVVAWDEGRTDVGMMPKAVVPAARAVLKRAGIGVEDCAVVKTHNPFAVNDLYFCREMGLELDRINHYGSPLIYGHPQAPMGTRVLIEVIEELVLLGGGYGLFTGCAAGDSAMAVLVRVG